MPIYGSMYIGHSKKLEWALRDFITSIGETYYDEELDKGILKSYLKLDNGIYVKQKVHIRKKDYICYTILSCHINSEDKKVVGRYIQMANAINLEIDYGHFEVNFRTGDILFKSYYEPDDKVSDRGFFKLLVDPRRMINKFGRCFLLLSKDELGI